MADLTRRRDVPEGAEKTARMVEHGAQLLGLVTGVTVWRVLSGPQSGATVRVEGTPVTVGSSSANALRLVDPSISRQHAEVTLVEEGALLRDLGSTNGTFVGGHRVRELFVGSGTEITFGVVRVKLESLEIRELPLPRGGDRFHDLVGGSESMRRLYGLLERVGASEVSVVIQGETGTGKELAASAVHRASRRAAGPFRVLDCSAVDRELVSAELFGHEPGAYTGAAGARAGAFEQASGGTLFLDEMGELPLELQAKLLRALEQREVRRLGGAKTIKVDCRVIAATHRDLAALVKEGRFREDLYYRLAQVVLKLPPLRERREDIPALVRGFQDRQAAAGATPPRFSPEALEALARLPLRGNVRELRNLVDRASALAAGPKIDLAQLIEMVGADAWTDAPPGTVTGTSPSGAPEVEVPPEPGALGPLERAERETIIAALRATGWHRQRAAAQLGISRQTLRDRMRRLAIEDGPRGSNR